MGLPDQAHIADALLWVMLIEYGALVLARRGWGAALTALLPGCLLVLALRSAAPTNMPSQQLLLMLALAFPAHLLDLYQRGWLRRNQSRSIPKPCPDRLDPRDAGDRGISGNTVRDP
jgi:hypothetical protein